MSAEEQKKVLRLFSKKFEENFLELLQMMNLSSLTSNEKKELVNELKLTEKVSHNNKKDELLAYLMLFPLEQWSAVLANDLQNMDLIKHEVIEVVVNDLITLNFSANDIKRVISSADLSNAICLMMNQHINSKEAARFLLAHATYADSLAAIMAFFHQTVGAPIDASLFSFLAAYEKQCEDFVEFINESATIDWIDHLADEKILNLDRMKGLLSHTYYIREIIAAFGDFYKLDADLCPGHIDFLLSKARNAAQVNFVRSIVDYCISKNVKLTTTMLDKVFQNNAEYPIEVDEGQLPFYAAMLGMTELLTSMIATSTIVVNQCDPDTGVSLLIEAVRYGQVEVIDMLLENGADPNEIITIKDYILQDALSDKDEPEQAERDMESEITMTAKDFATLLDNKEALASFISKENKAPEADVSVTGHGMFKSAPVAGQQTEKQEQDIPRNQPGSDK